MNRAASKSGYEPLIKTTLPGPKARKVLERDKKVITPAYTRGYPLVIERGEGSYVYDPDGNKFLDFTAGVAVNALGHAHPEIVRVIQEQAEKFIHMAGTDFYYDVMAAFAEKLGSLVPGKGAKPCFLANSGTEAIEAAIKLARYATRRPRMIAFFGAFHGRTLGALSLTASKAIQRRGFGPMAPGVFHAPYPDCYRCPLGLKPESCAAECLNYLENEIFLHLVSPDEVAAMLLRATISRRPTALPRLRRSMPS